ncbi:MAG: hypothetical protein V4514_05500 [Pseudomonadota bacterium]|nr:hypothetical protein [Phenylobacterium sp.]
MSGDEAFPIAGAEGRSSYHQRYEPVNAGEQALRNIGGASLHEQTLAMQGLHEAKQSQIAVAEIHRSSIPRASAALRTLRHEGQPIAVGILKSDIDEGAKTPLKVRKGGVRELRREAHLVAQGSERSRVQSRDDLLLA